MNDPSAEPPVVEVCNCGGDPFIILSVEGSTVVTPICVACFLDGPKSEPTASEIQTSDWTEDEWRDK